jgi:hypothetical protein
VDNADDDTGGNGTGNVTIKANSITANNVDTRGFRNDTRGVNNGSVVLQALSPLNNYDPNDSVNNAFTKQADGYRPDQHPRLHEPGRQV